jgi:hypothetical protein
MPQDVWLASIAWDIPNKQMSLAKLTEPLCLQQLSVISDSLLLDIVFLKCIHPATPTA